MVDIKGHMLPNLDLVDTFQDRQTVTHAVDSHLLEFIVLQGDQCFPYDSIFLTASSQHFLASNLA